MNRRILALSALVLVPLLSGCPTNYNLDMDAMMKNDTPGGGVVPDPTNYNPQVLSPGMGSDYSNPLSFSFAGLPNQSVLTQPFTIDSGNPSVTFDAVANYTGNPASGYSFSADILEVDADCVGGTEGCEPGVLDLTFKGPGTPPAWTKKPDYWIPIPNVTQVTGHLQLNATGYDNATPNKKPGVLVFAPAMQVAAPYPDAFPGGTIPAGRFAYLTIQGGGVAVVDTSPANPGAAPETTAGSPSFQGPAQVDLAVLARGAKKLNLFKGHGDGGFDLNVARDTGSSYSPQALCADDLDLDGDLDLAVANRHATSPENQAEVRVFWVGA